MEDFLRKTYAFNDHIKLLRRVLEYRRLVIAQKNLATLKKWTNRYVRNTIGNSCNRDTCMFHPKLKPWIWSVGNPPWLKTSFLWVGRFLFPSFLGTYYIQRWSWNAWAKSRIGVSQADRPHGRKIALLWIDGGVIYSFVLGFIWTFIQGFIYGFI